MKFIWVLIVAGMFAVAALESVHSEPLLWSTPVGTIGLPFESTEALIGYGAISKQAIGGFSLPVYSDPKQIVVFQLGAVAPWPVGQYATIQPYISLGHDILREIPALTNYKSLHANVFARYITDQGKADVGLSFSYSFLVAPTAPLP